jgi:hypothetical protein
MFSSFYKKRIPNFSINSLKNFNNFNNFNNLEFRKYTIESTNQSIQKKVELYKNNPYSKILKNEKEIIISNNFLAFTIFLSMYGFLYYFYNKKH